MENMPGFTPPTKWSSDPDKIIAQRELMAGDILFRRGLQRCQNVATANFIMKNFGNAVTTVKRAPKRILSTPALPAALQAIAPKKQSSLDAFIKQTAIITDEILARNMRAAKRASEKKKS